MDSLQYNYKCILLQQGIPTESAKVYIAYYYLSSSSYFVYIYYHRQLSAHTLKIPRGLVSSSLSTKTWRASGNTL